MRRFTPLPQCASGADAVLVIGAQLYCAACALVRPSLGAEPWMPRPLRAPKVDGRAAPGASWSSPASSSSCTSADQVTEKRNQVERKAGQRSTNTALSISSTSRSRSALSSTS